MTAKELVQRWLGSEHGDTPEREAKARGAAKRCNIAWSEVEKAAEQYRTDHPTTEKP